MFTIGGAALLTPRRRKFARLRFGQPVWLYVGNQMNLEGEWQVGDTKTPRFGARSVLIGYGTDAVGLRVISLVQRRIVTSLNVYAPSGGLSPVRDLVTSFRNCPFAAGAAGAWIWSVFKKEPRARLEAKGKDKREVEFFGKFILCSNNEDSFIKIDAHETRFWVRKIPSAFHEPAHPKMLPG